MSTMKINHHRATKSTQQVDQIKSAITQHIMNNPATSKIEVHFIYHEVEPTEKIKQIRELTKKMIFGAHAQYCVPSRCSCYLKYVHELRELVK
jgi:hypothetical protein